MKNRSRVEIISDILFSVKKGGETTRSTHILYKSNLSVPLLKKYMKSLLKDGLIEKTERKNSTFYKLTDKGFKFVRLLQKLNPMTEIIEIYKDKRARSAY